jgi:hypothetical protein
LSPTVSLSSASITHVTAWWADNPAQLSLPYSCAGSNWPCTHPRGFPCSATATAVNIVPDFAIYHVVIRVSCFVTTHDMRVICNALQGIVDQRLQESPENWRLVYKALLLLEFMVKHGPMVSHRWTLKNIRIKMLLCPALVHHVTGAHTADRQPQHAGCRAPKSCCVLQTSKTSILSVRFAFCPTPATPGTPHHPSLCPRWCAATAACSFGGPAGLL